MNEVAGGGIIFTGTSCGFIMWLRKGAWDQKIIKQT
jgi:hypothetical protein